MGRSSADMAAAMLNEGRACLMQGTLGSSACMENEFSYAQFPGRYVAESRANSDF
jgi:hypothetical protein